MELLFSRWDLHSLLLGALESIDLGYFRPLLGLNYERLWFRFATFWGHLLSQWPFPSGQPHLSLLSIIALISIPCVLPLLHPSSHHEDLPSRKHSNVFANMFVVMNAESSCSLA